MKNGEGISLAVRSFGGLLKGLGVTDTNVCKGHVCVFRAIMNTHYAIVNTLTRDREHSL